MFFIAPRNESRTSEDGGSNVAFEADRPSTKRKRLLPAPDEFGGYYPKRVPKACDRCRLKKVRCSGGQICARCEADAVVCVTTSTTAKDSAPINPDQLRLVESQRDRLVQILSKVLQRQDPAEAAKLQDVLASMGLSMQMLSEPRHAKADAGVDATSFDQVPQDVWLELYANLDGYDQNLPPLLSAADLGLGIDDSNNVPAAPKPMAAIRDQPVDGMMQFDDMVQWSPFDPSNPQGGSSYHDGTYLGASGKRDFFDGSPVPGK